MPLARDAPSATALAAAVASGTADPVELVEDALRRIADVDDELGAFVLVDADTARAEAASRAEDVRRGAPLGPLHGVPFAVKDLYDVAGQVTRAGSAVPHGPPARVDATAVARLREAGAVLVGRTRTHEMAWGITTQHAERGGTRNPWDLSRVPGGSSGGSAAAVAAGLVPIALGTDTGCSIRLPAAWCGLVGHKPTWGAVPLDGVHPLAPSLDHGGALVRDVADARLAHEVLTGSRLPPPGDLRGLAVGVLEAPGADPAVAALLEQTAARAAAAGLRCHPARQPHHDGLAATYGRLQGAEALAGHRAAGWWPSWASSYGRDVRGHLERAERFEALELEAAEDLRRQLRADVAELFAEVDLLLAPVAVSGPSLVERPDEGPGGGRLRDAVLPWTVLADLCGLPACAFPAGRDADGLPVGLQVLGPPGADARVLDAAALLLTPPW